MKDENGAVKIGASHLVSNELLASLPNSDFVDRELREKIAYHIGNEVYKSFPVMEMGDPALNARRYQQEVIVMTEDAYKKLAEYKWMYEGLNK